MKHLIEPKKNIIAINTLFLIPHEVGGTEYLTRSIITELSKQKTANHYLLFCNQENADSFKITTPNFTKITLPVFARSRLVRILYEQLVLPFVAIKHKCDILHSFGYFGPILHPFFKHVVTIHDANWRDHPEDMTLLTRIMSKFLIELNIRTANTILVDSDFSKTRIEHYFPTKKTKIKVVWPAVDEQFKITARTKQSSLFPTQKYFLCVSGFYPHKQVSYLIKLWKKIKPSTRLIIVGNNGKEKSQVLNQIATDDSIIHQKNITLTELVALYQHTQGFIFPSLYEGFGFPVYEALSLGIPTLVGNKKPYHQLVQPFLIELKNNFEQDLQIVKTFTTSHSQEKQKPITIGSYKETGKQLLSIYQDLLHA